MRAPLLPALVLSFLAVGCASALPTDILLQSGVLTDFARPGAVCITALDGNLALDARNDLALLLRARGVNVEPACPTFLPHVRIEVTASDTQMTTHGLVTGRIDIEARLEALAVGRPIASLWFLRPSGVYLRPEVKVLSEALRQLFDTGALPIRAVLIPNARRQ